MISSRTRKKKTPQLYSSFTNKYYKPNDLHILHLLVILTYPMKEILIVDTFIKEKMKG